MNITDYTYNLPPEKIALYPLEKRDESKLLIYKNGRIEHERFDRLPETLPSNTLLFFNNTRVVPARLKFQKESGADIEIFLLAPVSPSALMPEAMQARQACTWKCTIGNLKRWNTTVILLKHINGINLRVRLVDRNETLVEFSWDDDHTFAEIINRMGETPLPPYLKRKAERSDRERYQTIYSHNEGAVAAPTAGLHFTENVFSALKKKNIVHDFLTLHVSAGTFQPVKVGNPVAHTMHQEQIIVSRKNIEHLLLPDKFIVPVGTTSMRTLESVYWFGIKLLNDPDAEFLIDQKDPYRDYGILPEKEEALHAILALMNRKNTDFINGKSSIYIYPGYDFKFCNGLITNFHQPGSTLILLVAAFVGDDWRKIYKEALDNDYRFLSYGDSSILLPGIRNHRTNSVDP